MRRNVPQAKLENATGMRFGIAASRFNADLTEPLLQQCLETLAAAGVRSRDIRVLRVPGTFEVSVAAARLAKSGKYDCVIGLGVVLQGETSHAHHIADAVAHGLTEIAIATGVPTLYGIVTANTLQQARVRCRGKLNRGAEAARAAIEMALLWNKK
jgi:6,7-dimethyl-8-ribityllumazine synthase